MSIRILHHWACSGGTIFSRAIANLPNVVLLSEVHPLAHLRLPTASSGYAPTDLIQQLCLPHNGRDPVLCTSAWNGAIDALQHTLQQEKKYLVLRSHSHIDFFTGATCSNQPFVSRCLAPRHSLLELVSVRHPLDSWISIKAQGWHQHFRFPTLREFCKRCLEMLEACRSIPILRYEDFTLDPILCLGIVSDILRLPLPTQLDSTLSPIVLSGNSGRSGDAIAPRPRRPLSREITTEVEAELNLNIHHSPYLRLCSELGYCPTPSTPHPFTVPTMGRPNLLLPLAL